MLNNFLKKEKKRHRVEIAHIVIRAIFEYNINFLQKRATVSFLWRSY